MEQRKLKSTLVEKSVEDALRTKERIEKQVIYAGGSVSNSYILFGEGNVFTIVVEAEVNN